MAADSLREWFGIALGALATVGASGVLVWAGRRDRNEDKHKETQASLRRHAIEIRHTQKETSVDPVFPEYPADKL